MKRLKTEIIIVSLIFVFASQCSAILTGYEPHSSITDEREFGCKWQGGFSEGVNCTCTNEAQEMYITQNSISSYTTASIVIDGCKKVRFGPNSIKDIRNLRSIHLKDIASLYFEESSMTWYGSREKGPFEERYDVIIPSLSIKIENCNITQISGYTFEGRIRSIDFESVTIDNILPFAFSSLIQSQNIILKNVILKNIHEQAFKKFSTNILEFDRVTAAIIPSRFINNVTVFEYFKITRCFFETVRPGGFIVVNPSKFEVSDTKIHQLDGEGFKVITTGDVSFKNNVFIIVNDGAFSAINLSEERVVEAAIIFDSNVFTTLTRDSLNIDDSLKAKFINININETCDCTRVDHNIKAVEFHSEINCLLNDEFVTVAEFKSNMCSVIQSYSTVIVIVGVVFTLSLIIITVLVVYYRKVYLSKKYGSEKNSKTGGNMSLIVPDGRTYRETELHVIVERADLLTTDL